MVRKGYPGKKRRQVFCTDKKRSDRWKTLKRKTTAAVKKRRKKHEYVLAKFENESNPGKFFHHAKCLIGKNTAPAWSPMRMFPGESTEAVAKNYLNILMILAANMILSSLKTCQ